jgi:outer membrane lipoprotein-sorting protein
MNHEQRRSIRAALSKSRLGCRFRSPLILSLIVFLAFASGCSVSQKKVVKPSEAPAPLLAATKEELISKFNQQAEAVHSLNASVSMKLSAGSAYSGVIENYHEVDGFILAAKPSSIRVIGQAPVVGKNIFDMVSDGQTFHIFIPSKGKFIVGPVDLKRPAKKPIENLRPQHLIDALLWNPIAPPEYALFEEAVEPSGHFYILTVVQPASVDGETPGDSHSWEIERKIWFDRTNLSVVRFESYAQQGKLVSDTRYSAWESAGDPKYPREISIARPADDYELHITLKKVTLNEPIALDRFQLAQPPGTQLVDLSAESSESKDSKDAQPSESKPDESKSSESKSSESRQ